MQGFIKETRPRIAAYDRFEILNIELINYFKTGHSHQFDIENENDNIEDFGKEARHKQYQKILIRSFALDAHIKHKKYIMFCSKEYKKELK